MSMNSNSSPRNDVRCFLSALYLSVVWLTSEYSIPMYPFENVPLYVFFSGVMLIVLKVEVIKYAILLFVFLETYEVIKGIQPDFSYTLKGFLGIFALSCIMSTSWFSLKEIQKYSYEQIGKWLRIVLLTIFLSVFVHMILNIFDMADSVHENFIFSITAYSGFFREPSHLALGMAPYIFILINYFSVFKKYIGNASIFIVAAIALLSPSATLFSVLLAASVIALMIGGLNTRKGTSIRIGLGLFIIFPLFMYLTIAVPYIADRILGVLSSDNMFLIEDRNYSALAFIKGKAMAEYAILHFPFGVAFLDMQVLASKVSINFVTDWIYDLNSKDGASILFKGISELGILYVIFLIAASLRFFREILTSHSGSFFVIVIMAFEFSFFSQFFRGTTYFAGAVAFGLSALIFGLLHSRPLQKERLPFRRHDIVT